MMMMQLAKEAGFPDGIVNVIHGAHEAVDFILDDPTIRAVSFVGSDQVWPQNLTAYTHMRSSVFTVKLTYKRAHMSVKC